MKNHSPILLRDSLIDKIGAFCSRQDNICFISPDFGAKALDQFRIDHPECFIFTGISEQFSVDFAYGLALGSAIPILYGMAPFVTSRCFEQYKVLFGQTDHPLLLLGIGPGLSYDHNTISHYTLEDISLFQSLPSFQIFHPIDIDSGLNLLNNFVDSPNQVYMRVDRQPLPVNCLDIHTDLRRIGSSYFKKSSNNTLLISYGSIVFDLLITDYSLLCLQDLAFISDDILAIINSYDRIILVEESLPNNGIYSLLRHKVPNASFFDHKFIDPAIMFCKISQKEARRRFLLSSFCL